jgi:hypothetical protein
MAMDGGGMRGIHAPKRACVVTGFRVRPCLDSRPGQLGAVQGWPYGQRRWRAGRLPRAAGRR